jgi:hypothetical protein
MVYILKFILFSRLKAQQAETTKRNVKIYVDKKALKTHRAEDHRKT